MVEYVRVSAIPLALALALVPAPAPAPVLAPTPTAGNDTLCAAVLVGRSRGESESGRLVDAAAEANKARVLVAAHPLSWALGSARTGVSSNDSPCFFGDLRLGLLIRRHVLSCKLRAELYLQFCLLRFHLARRSS